MNTQVLHIDIINNIISEKLYCSKCGNELQRFVRNKGFDIFTGKKLTEIYQECLNKQNDGFLDDIFGLGHTSKKLGYNILTKNIKKLKVKKLYCYSIKNNEYKVVEYFRN